MLSGNLLNTGREVQLGGYDFWKHGPFMLRFKMLNARESFVASARRLDARPSSLDLSPRVESGNLKPSDSSQTRAWSDRVRRDLSALTVAALLVQAVDLLSQSLPAFSVRLGPLDWVRYFSTSLSFSLLVPLACALPLLLFLHQSSEGIKKAVLVLSSGLFGGLWQATALDGDGIRALTYFPLLQWLGWVLGPVFLIATTWIFMRERERGARAVPLVITASVWALALTVSSLALLRGYQEFLAYCLLACVASTACFVATWPRLNKLQTLGASLVVLALVSTTVSGFPAYQRLNQRYSAVTAAYLKLPLVKRLALPADGLFSRELTFQPEEVERFRSELARASLPSTPHRRGKNVLVVVLESTRADAWQDPQVAPKFHSWRKSGTYFPKAIAQYPATPLAYGAMFVAQPPAVLAQTPSWVKERPFLTLNRRFEHLIYTRPINRWFKVTTVTDFFVQQGSEMNDHVNAEDALAHLRKSIERVQDESFFAWAHLYEPHEPWEPRLNHLGEETGQRGAYLSEVSYLDAKLGDFMEWFNEQPQARETLVIVYADHGEGLGEVIDGVEFFGHHVHTRNILTHVPAYFSGPGIEANRVEEKIVVQQLDIVPTIFDFLGVELPEGSLVQGQSLYSLLRKRPTRELVSQALGIRGSAFFRFLNDVRETSRHKAHERFQKINASGKYAPNVALQYGDYKIIKDLLLGKVQLFDIKDDPYERKELSKRKPRVLREMKSRLGTWSRKQSWIIQELESRNAH